MSDIAIIGSGFSGLSAAAVLSQKGHNVTVYEKKMSLEVEHVSLKQRVTLSIWASWYWMPDVFDKFFNRFNKKSSDFYNLKQLDPGFQIIFDKENALSIPQIGLQF